MKEYALYKGEEILAMGTAKEISEIMGISINTVRFYSRNAYRRRVEKRKNPDKARVLVEIDLDEIIY